MARHHSGTGKSGLEEDLSSGVRLISKEIRETDERANTADLQGGNKWRVAWRRF